MSERGATTADRCDTVKLSVALCTFNGERYLPELLASLLALSPPPFEVVVRDDGSTDGTVRLLEEFKAQAGVPVRILADRQNLHFTGNFLRCAESCKGDYVLFCDQDDRWRSDKIAIIESAIRVGGAPRVLVHEGEVIDKNGVLQGIRLPYRSQYERTGMVPPFDSAAKGFAMAVRRDLIDSLLSCWNWDDYLMFRGRHGALMGHDLLLVSMVYPDGVGFINEALVEYRIHQSNVTAQQHSMDRGFRRLAGRWRRLQAGPEVYREHSVHWAAEVAFMEANMPLSHFEGLRLLQEYLAAKAKLWELRGSLYARDGLPRRKRLGLWRTVVAHNAISPSYVKSSRGSLLKDLVWGVFL